MAVICSQNIIVHTYVTSLMLELLDYVHNTNHMGVLGIYFTFKGDPGCTNYKTREENDFC